jgi:quaternary ammonium compound-resistance protein SugE
MSTAWGYLVVAGLFEIGWPLGLKLAQAPGRALLGIPMAVGGMSVSGWLLFLAQKEIPLGTAYAVWTGIGAAGTFLAGILLYGEAASAVRLLGVLLVVSGVVTLKLGH